MCLGCGRGCEVTFAVGRAAGVAVGELEGKEREWRPDAGEDGGVDNVKGLGTERRVGSCGDSGDEVVVAMVRCGENSKSLGRIYGDGEMGVKLEVGYLKSREAHIHNTPICHS